MPLAFNSDSLMRMSLTLLSLAGICQAACFNRKLIFALGVTCYQQPLGPTTVLCFSRGFSPMCMKEMFMVHCKITIKKKIVFRTEYIVSARFC